MSAQILDGKLIAERVRDEVKARAAGVRAAERTQARSRGGARRRRPRFARLRRTARRSTSGQVGMRGARAPPARRRVSQRELLDKVAALNADPDGRRHPGAAAAAQGARQPKRWFTASIRARTSTACIPCNAGLLASGGTGLRPCTPSGCMRLLAETGVDARGQARHRDRPQQPGGQAHRVHAAREELHRDPGALAHQGSRPARGRERHRDRRGGRARADQGQLDQARRRGDRRGHESPAPTSAWWATWSSRAPSERASWITPVPGGVGPMTIAMLMRTRSRPRRCALPECPWAAGLSFVHS